MLGMRQLWLPTVDHFEPSVDNLKDAVAFLKQHEVLGKRVYVHCRAGHGRSAAVVFAWLLYKNPSANPQLLNQQLCQKRNVRNKLWTQPNIREFHSWLKGGGRISAPGRTRSGASNDKVSTQAETEMDENGQSSDYGDENSSDDERDYQLWKKYKDSRDEYK